MYGPDTDINNPTTFNAIQFYTIHLTKYNSI